MKRFLSVLLTAILLTANIVPLSFGVTTSDGDDIDAPYGANYFADSVIVEYANATISTFEKTSDAEDSSEDLTLGMDSDDAIYFGFEENFDGVSMKFSEISRDGSYIVEYWNGSSWGTLLSEDEDDLGNSTSTGTLHLDWKRPTNWSKTTLDIDFNENGSSDTSDSLYFARLRLTSDYDSNAHISQMGLTVYNLNLEVEDEIGNELSDTTYDTDGTEILSQSSSNIHNLALDADDGETISYEITKDGYVAEDGTVTVNEGYTTEEVEMEFAYILSVEDEDGNPISNADIEVGNYDDCEEIDDGDYACAAPLGTDDSVIITADGYEELEDGLNSVRDNHDDAQVTQTFVMEEEDVVIEETDLPDLVVDDVWLDDDLEIVLSLENNGDADVEEDVHVYTYLYVDGTLKWTSSTENTSSSSYLNAGEDQTFYTGIELEEGDEYEVQVVVDKTDSVEEEDEDNNEWEDTFDLDDDVIIASEDPDLVVNNLWKDNDDIEFILQNESDEDIDEDEVIYTILYIDGDAEWAMNTTEEDYYEAEGTETYTAEDILEDLDEGTYEIEICVDTTDTVDEEDEDNNCRTENVNIDRSDNAKVPDLVVDNLWADDEDIEFVLQNEGDEDIDEDERIYTKLYIDGDLEWAMNTTDEAYYEAGESETYTAEDVLEDLDDGTYEIEICVDTTDTVTEDDEDNNCRTEDVRIDEDDDDDNEVDLVVDNLWSEGNNIEFILQNEGDEDIDEDELIYTKLYIDGDLEWTMYTVNDDYYEADGSETYIANDVLEDLDEGTYEIEICVDTTDTVDEESESNNCREEDVRVDEEDDDEEIDLVVDNIWADGDDIEFTLQNEGDEDIDDDEEIRTKLYIDGDYEWSMESEDEEFFEGEERQTFTAEDVLEDLDRGDTYQIKVCVDTSDTVDEDDEDNNCRTEVIRVGYDEEEHIACGVFYDLYDARWAINAICELYEENIIEGRETHYYEPTEDITRAEFLKIALLAADYDVYSIDSADDYSDISEEDWFYKYVTFATKRGFVEGYDDGTFRPNEPINRAEAVVILMRVACEDVWHYTTKDIPFWDVERSEWYTYAVVLAYEEDIIEGYHDRSFRPEDNLTRAEAAAMAYRAMKEIF